MVGQNGEYNERSDIYIYFWTRRRNANTVLTTQHYSNVQYSHVNKFIIKYTVVLVICSFDREWIADASGHAVLVGSNGILRWIFTNNIHDVGKTFSLFLAPIHYFLHIELIRYTYTRPSARQVVMSRATLVHPSHLHVPIILLFVLAKSATKKKCRKEFLKWKFYFMNHFNPINYTCLLLIELFYAACVVCS